jgi:hypothetical protein
MDEKGKKTETKEKFASRLVSLAMDVGWVFKHPILRELIFSAPSAKSVKDFVSEQFSTLKDKDELISVMLDAMKLWEHAKEGSGEIREELTKPSERSVLSDFFTFDGEPTDFPADYEGAGSLEFATAINLLPKFNKIINCSNWPLLLREFGASTKDAGNARTSFGYYGKINQFRSFEEVDGLFEKVSPRVYDRGVSRKLNDWGYKLSFKEKSLKRDLQLTVAFGQIIFETFGINSQIIKIGPQKGEPFPRIYKSVSVCEHLHEEAGSTIHILWPIDCSEGNQKGHLLFSRSIPLNRNGLEANLTFEFYFDEKFLLKPFPEYTTGKPTKYVSLQNRHGQQALLFQDSFPSPKTKKVQDVVGVLYEDFLKIWQYCIGQKISLESIIGEEMMRNPPSCLLDLFTGEKSESEKEN